MIAEVARAERAAMEHGFELLWDDEPWGAPGMSPRRIVRMVARRGREILARAAATYGDEAGKERAREFCAGVLFVRP